MSQTLRSRVAAALDMPRRSSAEQILAAVAGFRAKAVQSVAAEFASTETADEGSIQHHVLAVARLREQGIDAPTDEQYFEALELASPTVTTNPSPRAGDQGTMPKRKTRIDELPQRGGDEWTDQLEYELHLEALEILGVSAADEAGYEAYAEAVAQAQRAQSARKRRAA